MNSGKLVALALDVDGNGSWNVKGNLLVGGSGVITTTAGMARNQVKVSGSTSMTSAVAGHFWSRANCWARFNKAFRALRLLDFTSI